MATIRIVDDDLAAEILIENLRLRGHAADRYVGATAALASLDDLVSAEIVVLDIIMEPPEDDSVLTVSGVRSAGMLVYRALRERSTTLPILVFSATQDQDIVDIINQDPHASFLAKWGTPSLREVVARVESIVGTDGPTIQPVSFIVHGHNEERKLELKNHLQNVLNLPEPIILHEQPDMGRTIIEKFETFASEAHIAFILLTPDDRPADGDGDDKTKRRGRQNVILELGYFLGTLGRSTGRVLLLYDGPLDLPSDLGGVVYIDISRGIEAVSEKIRRELKNVR